MHMSFVLQSTESNLRNNKHGLQTTAFFIRPMRQLRLDIKLLKSNITDTYPADFESKTTHGLTKHEQKIELPVTSGLHHYNVSSYACNELHVTTEMPFLTGRPMRICHEIFYSKSIWTVAKKTAVKIFPSIPHEMHDHGETTKLATTPLNTLWVCGNYLYHLLVAHRIYAWVFHSILGIKANIFLKIVSIKFVKASVCVCCQSKTKGENWMIILK
jgi:hypothetical protein